MEQTPPSVNDYIQELNLCTELSTSRLYETKTFDDFVMARPILPQFYNHIRKLTPEEFSQEFEDYTGDRTAMRKFLRRYHPTPAEN